MKRKINFIGYKYRFSVIADDKERFGTVLVRSYPCLKNYLKTDFLKQIKAKKVDLRTLHYDVIFTVKEFVNQKETYLITKKENKNG